MGIKTSDGIELITFRSGAIKSIARGYPQRIAKLAGKSYKNKRTSEKASTKESSEGENNKKRRISVEKQKELNADKQPKQNLSKDTSLADAVALGEAVRNITVLRKKLALVLSYMNSSLGTDGCEKKLK